MNERNQMCYICAFVDSMLGIEVDQNEKDKKKNRKKK